MHAVLNLHNKDNTGTTVNCSVYGGVLILQDSTACTHFNVRDFKWDRAMMSGLRRCLH